MDCRRLSCIALLASLAGCGTESPDEPALDSSAVENRSFERIAPAFNALVAEDAVIEKIAGGFIFTEGPVWLPGAEGALLFSDIPADTVYRWTKSGGSEVFLFPVKDKDVDTGGAGGSNGLALDPDGKLILCEHGNRRVARMENDGSRTTLADRYEGRRLNSPNDIVFHSSGAAFFTDPPYGLERQDEDLAKEQPHNGVYRLDPDGTITLVVHDQTRPNGIGLSPDERTLYVANSDDPPNRLWMSYPVMDDLTLGQGTVFFDANALVEPGSPDGLAIDTNGNIYATGPGGVLLFNPNGQHLGTISLDEVPANVGWGDDGGTLYITAHTSIYRIELDVKGLGFHSN